MDNEIHRYAISPHLGELKYNIDGSLDIFIQHNSSGSEKESNWLSASLGTFNLLLRLYWPKTSVLNGHWNSPMVKRVNSIYR